MRQNAFKLNSCEVVVGGLHNSIILQIVLEQQEFAEH